MDSYLINDISLYVLVGEKGFITDMRGSTLSVIWKSSEQGENVMHWTWPVDRMEPWEERLCDMERERKERGSKGDPERGPTGQREPIGIIRIFPQIPLTLSFIVSKAISFLKYNMCHVLRELKFRTQWIALLYTLGNAINSSRRHCWLDFLSGKYLSFHTLFH